MTPDQLLARKQFIGASEAAAACGLSPWKTPYELWSDKTSDELDERDSSRMEWGRRLEAVVLLKYLEDLPPEAGTLQAPCEFQVSPDYPWMGCTPDGLLPDRVIEIKTAGMANSREWGEPGTDAVPLHYLIQVTHQMIVTGRKKADIPVLIGGSDYRVYSVELDEELAQLLIDRERVFWTHVEARTPPEVKSIADAQARWPKDTGVSVVATPEIADAVQRLAEVKAEQDRLEADADALSLAIRTCMADATTLTDSSGQALATWKAQLRSQFNFQGFKAAHPGLYAEFTDKIPTRVFRLAKGKARENV
jgi:putative phage-type endonuclease